MNFTYPFLFINLLSFISIDQILNDILNHQENSLFFIPFILNEFQHLFIINIII